MIIIMKTMMILVMMIVVMVLKIMTIFFAWQALLALTDSHLLWWETVPSSPQVTMMISEIRPDNDDDDENDDDDDDAIGDKADIHTTQAWAAPTRSLRLIQVSLATALCIIIDLDDNHHSPDYNHINTCVDLQTRLINHRSPIYQTEQYCICIRHGGEEVN